MGYTAGSASFISGPVTCLAVNANKATLNFNDMVGGGGITTVQVTDNQPTGNIFDISAAGRAATDCSPLAPTPNQVQDYGTISVLDNQPPP